MRAETDHHRGILSAPPPEHGSDSTGLRSPERGTRPLGLGSGRDGLVHGPARSTPDRPIPVLVMLHGAGASAQDVMPLVADAADAHGILVLAPDAREGTWDLIRHGYGPDVAFLDRALGHVFGAHWVDPARIAIAGFSDGASYALSLGLANGGLFGDVLAFSPGFAAPSRVAGEPRIFIAHGRQDPVLPFERCGAGSRRRSSSPATMSTFGHSAAGMSFRPKWLRPPCPASSAEARARSGTRRRPDAERPPPFGSGLSRASGRSRAELAPEISRGRRTCAVP